MEVESAVEYRVPVDGLRYVRAPCLPIRDGVWAFWVGRSCSRLLNTENLSSAHFGWIIDCPESLELLEFRRPELRRL